MKTKPILQLFLMITFVVFNLFAQEVPLVYEVENTGADCPAPPLPEFADLPVVEPLTDPFEWSDGSGRSTDFEDWSCRRAEIKAEIENYEIGPKPDRPDSITASVIGDTLTVNITVNGNTLTLTSIVTLPEGDGPFPAMIGMGGGSGSLPSDIFTSRDIALIPFNFFQVMAWQQTRGSEPINALYPDLIYMGAYSAWSWGVSRLIDGLELVSEDLPIDLEHLAVTGCSFAGKMALFAGAFDERIALTIPQESGGGGAAAWRVSETLSGVEDLGATSSVWFMESMFQFADNNVSKLPHDHHELMAMVAPRALFVIGNPSQVWLAEESGYVSCRAAHIVWETFGISDRMGFSFVTDHPHCALPASQYPEVEAFVDKFLLGDTTANTDISTNSYNLVNWDYWTYWWGTGEPVFEPRDADGSESVWLEAECATVGMNWDIKNHVTASNSYYVTVKSGLNSTSEAPTDSASTIYFPFTVTTDTSFFVFARLNCPTGNDDSFWVKMDDGPFEKSDGLVTSGWQWLLFPSAELTPGEHTLTVAYSEDGAKIDKLCISNSAYYPIAKGETAANVCEPVISDIEDTENFKNTINGYALGQNYPNPFNPSTEISFNLPEKSFVTLKIYDVMGREILTLINEEKAAGTHRVNFNAEGLGSGIYFYQLKAKDFTEKKKMILIK